MLFYQSVGSLPEERTRGKPARWPVKAGSSRQFTLAPACQPLRRTRLRHLKDYLWAGAVDGAAAGDAAAGDALLPPAILVPVVAAFFLQR